MLKPNSQVTTNLIRARELIADEKNWCQGLPQRDDRICAARAVWRACNAIPLGFDSPIPASTWNSLVVAAEQLFGWSDPVRVNDHKDHSSVMRMFDRAIELSLQEPGA